MPLPAELKSILKPVELSGDQTPEQAMNLAVRDYLYGAQTFLDLDDVDEKELRAELEKLTRSTRRSPS